MTTVSERHTYGSETELSSVLETLLERIETNGEPNDAYSMTADEIDTMLGLHRSLYALDTDTDRSGDQTLAPTEGSDGAVSSEGIADLREGSIFEPQTRRSEIVRRAVLPAVSIGLVAGVVSWSIWSGSVAGVPDAPVATTTVAAIEPAHVGEQAPSADETGETTFAAGAQVLSSDADIASAVEAALAGAGVDHARVEVVDGLVTVDAVAPTDLLADGYFARRDQLVRLASAPGAMSIELQLELRGDPTMLMVGLDEITARSPVLFDSGSSLIRPEDMPTLDAVAQAISEQPGLPVIIAGTTDTSGSVSTNERLARERAAAVASELVARGIPSNRLQVVSYGELFGDHGESARTIRFEVGS